VRVHSVRVESGKERGEGPSGSFIPLGSGKNFSELLKERIAGDGVTPSGGRTYEYTVKPGDTLWKIGAQIFKVDPLKIAKDNGIANPDLIHPGQKLKIETPAPAVPQLVTASWYGKEYHNRPTASGEIFNMFGNTLAHKTLPLGTEVRLINPETGQTVTGRINDRGPFIRGRDVDVSYGLAKRLGLVAKGVGKLVMEIL